MKRHLAVSLVSATAAPLLAVAAPAHAADSTKALLAELHAAAAPTTTASARGWAIDTSLRLHDGQRSRSSAALDTVHHLAAAALFNNGKLSERSVTVTGRGQYLQAPAYARLTTDLRLLHKSWLFIADPDADADELQKQAPAVFLDKRTLADSTVRSVTRADAPGGGRVYTVTGISSGAAYSLVYTLDATGKLVRFTSSNSQVPSATSAISYGTPRITVPAHSRYAREAEVDRVDGEVSHLGARVRNTAARLVTGAKAAARAAHRRSLLPRDLRAGVAFARRHPTTRYVPVTITAVCRGWRVASTSPRTHKTVSRVVTLVHGKAVIH